MSISEKFQKFCINLRMNDQIVSDIRYRVGRITRRLNSDFWSSESSSSHILYVGSYGRGTDIHVSDIDLIFQLPYSQYQKYDQYLSNGQSALIQAVKESIKKTYASTHVRGDGQVVQLKFSDGICFEIVPAFIYKDGESFTYPDTNNGGTWKTTNPRAEKRAFNSLNTTTNKNLKRLCRMARAWKDTWSVPISGILLDTLAYNFIKNWEYRDKSYVYYDWMTRDFFSYLKDQNPSQNYWLAPGSSQYVYRTGKFEHIALQCYDLSLQALGYENQNMPYSANDKWRKIYGSKFPI